MSKVAEQQVVADREAVRTEVSGIRAGAARLLDLFDYEAGQLLKDGTVVPEKNRTPPAKERVHKKVVGPEGKKTGQKSVKNSPSRGRG